MDRDLEPEYGPELIFSKGELEAKEQLEAKVDKDNTDLEIVFDDEPEDVGPIFDDEPNWNDHGQAKESIKMVKEELENLDEFPMVDKPNKAKDGPTIQIIESSSDTWSLFDSYLFNHGDSIHETTWRICSDHFQNISKKNHSNQSYGEEVMQLSTQTISSLRDLDMRAFKGDFRTNQKELSHETNFPEFLIHHRGCENWNHFKTGSYGKDMNFTIRWFCLRFYSATKPKIESPSQTQVQFGPETNWNFFLDLLAFQQAQYQRQSPSDQKDTSHFPKCVNLVHYLEIARSIWIRSLQTYVWHP